MSANLSKLNIGVVGVQPGLFFLESTDDLGTVSSAGYLSSPELSPGDFILANYNGGNAVFIVEESNGVVTLNPNFQPGAGGFAYVKTYFLAANGDDANAGDEMSAPLQTLAAAFAKMTDSNALYFFNVLDAGIYTSASPLISSATYVLNAPGAFISMTSSGYFLCTSLKTAVINASFIEAPTAASKFCQIGSDATAYFRVASVVGSIEVQFGRGYVTAGTMNGNPTAPGGGGPATVYLNVDNFTQASPFSSKGLVGRLGQTVYGDLSVNAQLKGAAYPDVSISSTTTVSETWGNSVVNAFGAVDFQVMLPNETTAPLIPIGAHFLLVQNGAGKVEFVADSFITLLSNTGVTTTAGVGSTAYVVKTAADVWSVNNIQVGETVNLINTYYFTESGNDANSGKNILQPKKSLQACFDDADDPNATNFIIGLDSNDYLLGAPLSFPTTGKWIISAPGATFTRLTGTVFNFQDGTNIYIQCDAINTAVLDNAITMTGATSQARITCNSINGGISGGAGSLLHINVGQMTGTINNPEGTNWQIVCPEAEGLNLLSPNYIGGNTTARVNFGGFMGDCEVTSEYGVYNHGAYRPMPIDGTTGALGYLNYGSMIVYENASNGTFQLPIASDIAFPEGTYFVVLQTASGKLNFIKGHFYDNIISKVGENVRTNGEGAMVTVFLKTLGDPSSGTSESTWVIAGDIETAP